jgi:hypothetical protein
MQILLREMLEQQRTLAKDMEARFTTYFRETAVPDFDVEPSAPGILVRKIATPGDSKETVHERIRALPRKSGLYILMTDYAVEDAGSCSFMAGRSVSKAIYRGHSANVMERVMGHLINQEYLRMCSSLKNKKPWGSYLKISDKVEGNGGIDITHACYADCNWAVVVFEMTPSSRLLREYAENGFAAAFGVPARSKNEPNSPISG